MLFARLTFLQNATAFPSGEAAAQLSPPFPPAERHPPFSRVRTDVTKRALGPSGADLSVTTSH